jgi:hypothetical protein
MPAETDNPQAEVQTQQNEWEDLGDQKSRGLERIVSTEVVKDQHGFLRTRFFVDESHSFVFRGREDLPELESSPEFATTEVLTKDEFPAYTPQEDYKKWAAQTDETDNKAAETATKREFIASDSPLGIVDAAIKISAIQETEDYHKAYLQELREKMVSGTCDEEVLALYDNIVVAGVISENGKLISGEASPDGPMIVALALAGDQATKNILSLRQQVLQEYDQRKNVNETGEPLKHPGAPLNEEELRLLDDAKLVAVHTTSSYPLPLGTTGMRTIFPTGEFDTGTVKHYPRSTIHWSLNHPVTSHMSGSFSDRPITIVSPLSELARENGAPDVLAGVDTYFAFDPGRPQVISPKTAIIKLQERDGAFIEQSSEGYSIRATQLTSKDLQQLRDLIYENQQATERSADLVHDIIQEAQFDDLYSNWIAKKPDKLSQLPEVQEYNVPYKSMHNLVISQLPEVYSENEYKDKVKQTVASLIDGTTELGNYPVLHGLIVETTRKLLVQKAIRKFGGEVVRSNADSQFIFDAEFSEKEKELQEKIGLRGGLHASSAEGFLEEVFDEVRNVPTRAREDGSGRGVFKWDKYNDEMLWKSMVNCSPQARRQLVRSGMLNFTPKLLENKSDPLAESEF